MINSTPSDRLQDAIAAGMEDAWAAKAGHVSETQMQRFRERLMAAGVTGANASAAGAVANLPKRHQTAWALAASVAAVCVVGTLLSVQINKGTDLAVEKTEPTRGVLAVFRVSQDQPRVEAALQAAGIAFSRVLGEPGALKANVAADQLLRFQMALKTLGLDPDAYPAEAAGDYLLLTKGLPSYAQ
ncbi:MAG: hypothetical protein Q7J29_00250 [Stagnimonas sp.]|nr:hypothetical protein [Stagnimonas sp.]